MEEAGGWLTMLMNVGAVVLLGAALAYGLWTWRVKRSAGLERLRDRKTRDLQRQRDPDEAPPLPGRRG